MTKRSHGACNLRSRRRSTEVPILLSLSHCQPVAVWPVRWQQVRRRNAGTQCTATHKLGAFACRINFSSSRVGTIYVFRLGMLISVAVVIGLVGIEDAICIHALVILRRYNMYTFLLSI